MIQGDNMKSLKEIDWYGIMKAIVWMFIAILVGLLTGGKRRRW